MYVGSDLSRAGGQGYCLSSLMWLEHPHTVQCLDCTRCPVDPQGVSLLPVTCSPTFVSILVSTMRGEPAVECTFAPLLIGGDYKSPKFPIKGKTSKPRALPVLASALIVKHLALYFLVRCFVVVEGHG